MTSVDCVMSCVVLKAYTTRRAFNGSGGYDVVVTETCCGFPSRCRLVGRVYLKVRHEMLAVRIIITACFASAMPPYLFPDLATRIMKMFFSVMLGRIVAVGYTMQQQNAAHSNSASHSLQVHPSLQRLVD